MTVQSMSKIKIKRSTGIAKPTVLEAGELAYSFGAGAQNDFGDRLFFGDGTNVNTIGGKYFTDMLDHVHGILTIDSAIVTDGSGKVDTIKTTNLQIGGVASGGYDNSIRATNINGDINLDTGGTGSTGGSVHISGAFYLPNVDGDVGQVLTSNADHTTSWKDPAAYLTINANDSLNYPTLAAQAGGTADVSIDLLNETFNILGDSAKGLRTTSSSSLNSVTITANYAGYTGSGYGVSQYNDAGFVLSSGNVSLAGTVAQTFTTDGVSTTSQPNSNSFNISGDSTYGIVTSNITNGVKISGKIASSSQLGVAKFSDTYFYVGSSTGNVTMVLATSSLDGVAHFPTSQFTVSSGEVTILAAHHGSASQAGVATFNTDNFTVTEGYVSANSTYIGTTELKLGDTDTSNLNLLGLSKIEVSDFKIENNKISNVSAITKDILISPYAGGAVKINDAYTLPTNSGTEGYVMMMGSLNAATWTEIGKTFKFKDSTDTATFSDLKDDTFKFYGDLNGTDLKYGAITTEVNSTNGSKGIKIKVRFASDVVTGVASFNSANFETSINGDVTIKDAGVPNAKLANAGTTLGSSTFYLGSTGYDLVNMDYAEFSDIIIGSSTTVSGGAANRITAKDNGGAQNLILTSQSGNVQINGSGNSYTLPSGRAPGTDKPYVLTYTATGVATWEEISTKLLIAGDNATFDDLDRKSDTLSFNGTSAQGISVEVQDHVGYVGSASGKISNVNFTISDAATGISSAQKGVASFNSSDFGAGSGFVSLDNSVIKKVKADSGTDITSTDHSFEIKGYTGSYFARSNAISTLTDGSTVNIIARTADTESAGVASFSSTNFTVSEFGAVSSNTFYIGSTAFNLGQTYTSTITGLTNVTIGNIQIHDNNKIEYTTSDNEIDTGDIVLKPFTKVGYLAGAGVVDVSSSRITNVATPTAGTDAVNKNYADSLVSGLDIKVSVRAATNAALTATYANGPGTLTNSGTQAAIVVDGVTLVLGDRVLVKNQGITVDGAGAKTAGADAVQNGIYTVTTLGSISANWVLTRADDANNTPEGEVTGGMFTFVEEGTNWADSGFILVAADGAVTLGTTYLTFTQFSAAGQTMAGLGLSKAGDTLNVEVNDSTGGIEITADKIQLKSSLAGNGLSYTSGVLSVIGTTDRISVNAASPYNVDIASTYAGQSTIITLGTITTGVWEGTKIAANHGGTGHDTYSKGDILYADTTSNNTLAKLTAGSDYQFLMIDGTTHLPVWADIDGGTY
jgi:hypothetical protein